MGLMDRNKQVLPSEWENRESPSSILPSFGNAFQSADLHEKLSNLYSNLTEKDRSTLSRVLNNFQRLFAGAPPESIFSARESEEITNYLNTIHSRQVKIRDDLYCYNGYFLPISHFAPDLFIGRLSYDLLDNPDYIQGKEIIDAGGYVGDSALVMSSWTTGRVHIFEPISSHQAQIKKTIQYNDLKNCVIVPNGLGDKKDIVQIAFYGSGSSINKFNQNVFDALNKETIKVITLDEYVRERQLKIGFIKIDVEGFEQPLLRGALATIRSQRPILYISIYHNADDFFNIKPMIEKLDLGYKFKIAKVPNGGILVETALIAEPA